MTGLFVHDALLTEVESLFTQLNAEIAARNPICQSSGRCCKFEQFGHRLYVTRVELDYFAAVQMSNAPEKHASRKSTPLPLLGENGSINPGCPFQINGLCTARDARPLGCRVYFCDESAKEWQEKVYERFHTRLRALHQKYAIPYEYVEWRAGLRMLGMV